MENEVSNILGRIIAISNIVSNSQVNNRPKKELEDIELYLNKL